MAAKTDQSKQEAETTIRWDETGEPATLWTASVKVRNEWRLCGYDYQVQGGGWRTIAPVDRIVFKPLKRLSKSEAEKQSSN